ncbi:unnamed protein product [Didymodactylos carnosus]|uniref:Uncharacterized protein n=1 Tax=Didymodactylos carnosus TaxID=1234261 RepID=A0A816CES0_9BILA|nr:unnamed protein product [Didymodactylos carnosus]CAF1622470.1 unnamed protein product [Didymodactylos carnosus]CAF3579511.1 unnamed protein product [Didymodactylos carnosus]CAF4513758.1 unnamed protein product [Didymodactylos carnosus]
MLALVAPGLRAVYNSIDIDNNKRNCTYHNRFCNVIEMYEPLFSNGDPCEDDYVQYVTGREELRLIRDLILLNMGSYAMFNKPFLSIGNCSQYLSRWWQTMRRRTTGVSPVTSQYIVSNENTVDSRNAQNDQNTTQDEILFQSEKANTMVYFARVFILLLFVIIGFSILIANINPFYYTNKVKLPFDILEAGMFLIMLILLCVSLRYQKSGIEMAPKPDILARS